MQNWFNTVAEELVSSEIRKYKIPTIRCISLCFRWYTINLFSTNCKTTWIYLKSSFIRSISTECLRKQQVNKIKGVKIISQALEDNRIRKYNIFTQKVQIFACNITMNWSFGYHNIFLLLLYSASEENKYLILSPFSEIFSFLS